MRLGPYWIIRDTGVPNDLPSRSRRELVSARLRVDGLEGALRSLEREAEIQNDEAERLHEQLELCEQSRNLLTTEVHGLLEQLEAERAAGGEWASIAGEQMARAKTAREVLTDISHLDGNLSARILADRWLDADEQASNPARES